LAVAVSQSQTTNEAQVALRELESSAQTYRALYDNFLQRYMESVQQQSFPITEARVITKASRPLEKSYPKTALVLAISTVGGIALGLGLAMSRDWLDRAFRTREQVETTLQMDCIAVIPMVKGGAGGRLSSDNGSGVGYIGPGIVARKPNVFWTVVDAPFSRFTESIRSIKSAVDLSAGNKIIGLTSSFSEEGKSTIAAALALLAARAGTRTILVDCDLRNPVLSRTLAPGAERGILDVISGKTALEDAIWSEPTTGMAVLPTVNTGSGQAGSGEILHSGATNELFNKLRKNYDCVIVDVPPLEPIADVRATAHVIDCYIFVIQWGQTRSDLIERAIRSARCVHEKILGAVLNKTNMRMLSRYQGFREMDNNRDEHAG
jgi:succinoglycan biosynthesis transport protein ExoP